MKFYKLLKNLYEKLWGNLHFVRVTEWKYIKKWLNAKKSEKILDLACGGGFFSEKASKSGAIVCGIDNDSNVIKIANKFHSSKNCLFDVASADKLPYDKESFDKVFSICAFEHFDDDTGVLKELRRVLRNHGLLVLSLDSFSYHRISKETKEKHRKKEHVVNFYIHETAKSKLENNGFKILDYRYILNSYVSHLFMLLWMKMNFSRIFLILFPIICPLSRISDKFFGRNNEGYILLIKAQKNS